MTMVRLQLALAHPPLPAHAVEVQERELPKL
jgi:hypothetical protein